MEDSREFDLDRMMERIRRNVHDKRLQTEGHPALDGQAEAGQPEADRDLGTLHNSYDVSSVSLDPHRRIFGRTMLLAARCVAELLKPLIRQQAEYNAANTRLTHCVQRQVDRLRQQLVELGATTERALARNPQDFKAQTEALARRFAKLHAGDFAMHAQALGDFSHRVAALEQGRADVQEQSRRLDELVRREESHCAALRALAQRVELLAQQQVSRLEQQDRRFEQLDERYTQAATQIEARLSALAAQLEAARAAQSQIRSQHDEFQSTPERILRVERRLRRIPSAGRGNDATTLPQTPPAVVPANSGMDYAGFEDRLRASQLVKEKQRAYVPHFAGKAPVIDVGCGRGEFLELMGEAGIEVRGLDRDPDMILLCREKRLDVSRCDAIDYLDHIPDNSIGGIFSAQVIEHLTTAQLTALVKLAFRKLRPGGIILLETLNPESLFVHYKWFWMDPSHVRLVHPQTLQYLLESAGFIEVSCSFNSPPVGVVPIPQLPANGSGPMEEFNRATDYLNKLIYRDQEYFVVGRT